ncbi:cell surface protein SprA [Candidatus Latescibacterota bacterium]
MCGFLSVRVSADFFNSSWYEQRLEDERNSKFLFTGENLFGETYREQPDSVVAFTRILPPNRFLKPLTTTADSLDFDKSRVRKLTEIPGLRVEQYYFVPLDSHIRENLDLNRDSIWSATVKKKMATWTSDKKSEGITDLNFVIPIGSGFESFVGGTTNINIDGTERIEFSGKSEFDEGVIETATSKNSTFPSLTMKQEPKFTIRGNIGDRITVDIKQDSSEGSFSNLEENISLKYQGEEQDVIKYIEAGNTSLNLQGATFAGYSGSHKGLFGIRAESQIGPLEITTIASQEKGESNSKSFRGTAEEASKQIKDYEYKSNTYFFLDFEYRDKFANNRDSFDRIFYDPADSLAVFEVYINDGNNSNDSNEGTLAYPGKAWPMSLTDRNLDNEDAYVEGFFHRLDPSRFYVNRELGYIQFATRIPDDATIGVYMQTAGGEEFGTLQYDTSDPTSQNEFKLIKRKGQRPTDEDTWDLEWKNVYDLGQQNIDLDGLEIRIFKQATDGVSRDKQGGVPYIEILGLDKVDENGAPTPDNKVDFNRAFVDRYRGELVFPLLRPFDDEKPAGVDVELEDHVPEIYDAYNRKEKEEATLYYLEIKTANRQSTIRLPVGFGGILENTEEVLLDGRKLARGADYRINYYSGEITLLNEEAQSPNANLDFKWQDAAAFQPMQKTLFGIRGEYELNADSRIGAVFLFNNESTKDKRVRLGNEPSRTMLFDIDTDLNFQPKVLTTAVDMIPGVVASTPSKIRVEGEFARSMPNMNTHGEVYIDDFEGSQNTPFGIMRSNWTLGAKPDEASEAGKNLAYKGRLHWYNPWDRIDSEDIWPKKETTPGENTVHVLNLAYHKSDEIGAGADDSFAGITNPFWGTGIDLSRARFIEVWARGDKGTLKIDLGSISEDYYNKAAPNSAVGDGILNTEDIPIPGQGQGDNVLTKEEDTGLDGIFDSAEGATKDNPDPNGDNWRFDSKSDYSRINGTEGNAQDSDRSGIPDTEDINYNGILDTLNKYYEYSISFDDQMDQYLVEDSVPAGDPSGWRLFRIPLWNNPDAIRDGTTEKPDSTLIEFGRLWITGTDSTVIQIASIEVVESNWLEQGIYDAENNDVTSDNEMEVTRISTKNTHENLEYTSPPGVKGELDRDTKIRQKEQSIVLEVENLDPGNAAFIYRNFEKMDLTDYTALKLNVHGPDTFPVASTGESEYEFIVRFGGDKKNYYEYRQPIYQGWADENLVDIDFATCTELKLIDEFSLNEDDIVDAITDSLSLIYFDTYFQSSPDSASAQAYADSLVESVEDSLHNEIYDSISEALIKKVGEKTYAIHGKPSLNNVKILSFGFRNNQEIGTVTDEIWLDELRMDDLRDMTGTAYRASFNTDLSGFIQLTGKISEKSADFHGMNTKKGTGQDDTSWDTSIRANLDRFTPKRWGLSLPVSASVAESNALPMFKSGSDIVLPDDQKHEFRKSSTDKKARISYKKSNDPSLTGMKGFVSRWAFEKVSADFDISERYSLDPNSGESNSDSKQLKVGYDVKPKAKGFVLLGWMPILPTELGEKISNATFNFTPSALNYNYSLGEKNLYKTDVDNIVEAPKKTKLSNEKLNFSYDPFRALKYSLEITREKDHLINKQEVTYKEINKLALTGPELLNTTNKYSYDIVYDEENNPKFSLSGQLGSRTVRFTKSFSATAEFALDEFLEEKISGRPKPPKTAVTIDPDRPTWGSVFRLGGKEEKTEPEEKETEEKEAEETPEKRKVTVVDVSKEMARTSAEKPPPAAPPKKPEAAKKDEKDDEDPEEEPKKKGEGIRTKIVMAIAETVSPISFEFKKGEQFNYSGIKDRPDIFQRLGREAISPPDSSSVVSSRNTSEEKKSFGTRTRFMFPLDIGLSANTKFDATDRETSSVSERSENSTVPDLSLSWSKVEDKFENSVPFIKKYFTNININSSFAVQNNTSFQNNSARPTSEKGEVKFAPLISLSSRIMNMFNASFSLNNSDAESKDLSGEITSTSLTNTLGTQTKIQYKIDSSNNIPFLSRLKLKSDIDLNLEYSTTASTTERQVGNEEGALIKDDTKSTIALRAEYFFSQKFRGGAKMSFSSAKNITKKVHKIREVSIWCEMSFN